MKLRFGVVGIGAVAQSYLRAFEHCELAEIVGLADYRIDAARRTAERMAAMGTDAPSE